MKRGVIIVIGSVILVVGLTGLALLQTGVIYPKASVGPINLCEDKSLKPPSESGQQASGPAVRRTRGGASVRAGAFCRPGDPKTGYGPSDFGKGARRDQGQAQAEQPRTHPRGALRLTGSAGKRPANTNRNSMPITRHRLKPRNPL